MRTHPIAVASILGLLLAGCASTLVQQTESGNANSSTGGASANTSADDSVKERPFTAETRFAAGQLAETQNNPNQAVIQYQEALKLKPDYLGALYRLGVVYAELKQYPQAIDVWGRYIGASGEDPTAFGDLGFCEELSGDSAKAEAAYKKGIDKDPKNAVCRVNYGLMLARAGKIDAATEQWRVVLSEAEIHYNLGGIYAQKGHKEQARGEFNKALELDPKFTDAKSRVSELDQN